MAGINGYDPFVCNHTEEAAFARTMSDESLKHSLLDAREARRNYDPNGKYADQCSIYAAEIRRREKERKDDLLKNMSKEELISIIEQLKGDSK